MRLCKTHSFKNTMTESQEQRLDKFRTLLRALESSQYRFKLSIHNGKQFEEVLFTERYKEIDAALVTYFAHADKHRDINIDFFEALEGRHAACLEVRDGSMCLTTMVNNEDADNFARIVGSYYPELVREKDINPF